MDSIDTDSLHLLRNILLEDATSFDFFQAVYLLKRIQSAADQSSEESRLAASSGNLHDETITTADDYDDDIQLKASLAVNYTESDIDQITYTENTKSYEISTHLTGLYGGISPLPDFYTDELIDNEWESLEAPRQFLDIIHNQVYKKLFAAWKLNKFSLNAIERDDKRYWRILNSLSGSPNEVIDEEIKSFHGRFIHLFTLQDRTIEGVRIISRDVLNVKAVKIEEFSKTIHQIPLEQQCILGVANHQLGVAHLGSCILDRSQSITLVIEEVIDGSYSVFLTFKQRVATLKKLLALYLRRSIDIFVRCTISEGISTLRLGSDESRLGELSFLVGSSEQDKTITL